MNIGLIRKRNKSKQVDEKPKESKSNSYVNTVAKEKQIAYEEAYAIMQTIKDKYHISFSAFAKGKLFLYEGDHLEDEAKALSETMAKRNAHAINMIAKATGWSKKETIIETERIKDKFNIGIRTYWLRQLYEKTDDEILEYKKQEKAKKDARIQIVCDAAGWSKKEVKDHMAYCKTHFQVNTPEYYVNFKCWELTDAQLRNFAVDDDSCRLSKKYNRQVSLLTNKFKFNQTFNAYLGRKYWKNTNTSLDEFMEFTEGLDKVFCKPLNLSSGVGAKVVEIPKDKKQKIALYEKFINENEILAEEFIVQHEKMNQVYSGSVNTIRLTMLKTEDGCHRLWSFVRFGNGGIVDNFHGGGMAAAVDVETGILMTDAMNSDGEFFQVHPITGVKFKGFQIPHWDKVKSITEEALLSQNKVAYVGWDIAISPDKVVLVEGNSTPQVGVYQSLMAPAGQKPLYAKYLD